MDKESDFESEDSGFECHQGFETVMGRQTSKIKEGGPECAAVQRDACGSSLETRRRL